MDKDVSLHTTSLPVINQSYERKSWWKYVQMLLDSLAWLCALPIAFMLRYGLDISLIDERGLVIVAGMMIAFQLGVGYLAGLYRDRYSYGSFHEGRILYPLVAFNTLLMQGFLLISAWHIGVPRSVVVIAFPIAVLLMMGLRYLKRLYEDQTNRPDSSNSEPVIVFGAGYLGRNVVSNLMSDPSSKYRPVAIVDDDESMQKARIHSVRVVGNSADLPSLVKRYHVSKVLIAIGETIPERRLVRITQAMKELGVETIRITSAIPDIEGIKSGAGEDDDRNMLEKIRGKIDYQIDETAIADYVTGRRVLVTGAGGSIGSELCRQISKYSPAELMMLDRDESLLMDTKYSMTGLSSLDDSSVVLADVRDYDALQAVFLERQPEVVFHAAALKHVSALEAYPKEAYKTNSLGTANVLRAAAEVEVEVFVNVSTDKAADPTTALGQSKRTAEMLTSWYGEKTGKKYVSVRFGNVFGSRGSIKPLFAKQIQDGGPLTVTDEDATRFFMLIPDACLLVMLAGAIGESGEVLVLDMGEPVSILKIAEHMRRMYERYDVEIQIIGLRPGEKKDEVLFGAGEQSRRSRRNPYILHAQAPVLNPAELDYSTWFENYRDHRGYTRSDHQGQEA